MAALYGRLQGNRGEATRLGTGRSGLRARLETWEGSVSVRLEADGRYAVCIGPKDGYTTVTVAAGNVNTDWRDDDRTGITLDTEA